MSIQYPIPRSHPGRPVKRWAWPLQALVQEREEFVSFVAVNKECAPMLELYDRLVSSGGESLFGKKIMGGGMVLANRQEVAWEEGLIVIEFDSRKKLFSLSYRNSAVELGKFEQCSTADIWERLRLFVAYKFGVRLKKGPESSPTPAKSV